MSSVNGITPSQFLDSVQEKKRPGAPEFAIVSTIQSDGLTLQFEDGSPSSSKRYKRLDSYVPTVGDRVYVVSISGSGLVMGKVV